MEHNSSLVYRIMSGPNQKIIFGAPGWPILPGMELRRLLSIETAFTPTARPLR
jgi:hypothetical protein